MLNNFFVFFLWSGLGECLLAMAKTAMEDYLDGSAVDLIQEAITYLFR